MITENSAKAVSQFVSSVAVHFPPPRFDSPEQETEWLRSIIESLKGYEADILRRAAQRIIDTRGLRDGERWFPLPAAIRKVCSEIVADDNRQSLPLVDVSPGSGQSRNRWLAYELMRAGSMGKRAVEEGWVTSLFDWVREHGKLPSETERSTRKTLDRDVEGRVSWRHISAIEVDHCREMARGADEAYRLCISGGFPLASSLANFGEAREAWGEVLADHVAGKLDLRHASGRSEIEDRIKAKVADRRRMEKGGVAA